MYFSITQALAGELSGTGVGVQVCLPGVVATEFHTLVGRDPGKMPPMMTAADVVAASLATFARGEVTCIPSLDDASLLERLAEAQRAVVGSAGLTPTLARRYRSSTA